MLGAALIAGAASGALDQMFSSISQSRNWKYTKQSMDYQQKLNERNMKLQYSYARDFYDYQNEYNDPRNAVARWRSAGIAPAAVFGSSPGGAGVGGSFSSPTSQNPSASGVSDSSGYAPVMTLGDIQRVKNESLVAEAQARKLNAEAAGQEWQNTLQPQYERQLDAIISGLESDAAKKAVESAWTPFQLAMQMALQNKDLQAKDKAIEKFSAEIDELVSRKELNEADAQKAKEGANLLAAQTLTENESRPWKVENLERDVQLKASQTALNWYERDVIKPAESRKIKADTVEAKKRAKQVDAEIERLGKLSNYTEEQINYLKHLRRIAWWKFAVSTAKTVSEEARGWLGLLKNKSVSSAASSSFDDDALGAIAATL